jgi:low affinity Fe/Cu permease
MNWFSYAARWTADQFGRAYAFVGASLLILLWIATGPLFNWSDTWQLICNTVTTIITFLAVFLLQHTQNRDMLALQLKLDELVLSVGAASNNFVRIEDLTESELRTLRERRDKARAQGGR